MRLLSAVIRLVSGGALMAFAAVTYVRFHLLLRSWDLPDIFGRPVPRGVAVGVMLAGGVVGMALFLLGLRTLRQRHPNP